MNRAWMTLTVVGGVSILGVALLLLMEGIKYLTREDQGLDPVPPPSWVAVSSYVGLGIFMLALIGLALLGIVALSRRRGRASP